MIGNLDLGGNLLGIDLGRGCPMKAILGAGCVEREKDLTPFCQAGRNNGDFLKKQIWQIIQLLSYWFVVITETPQQKAVFFSCSTDMKSESVWDKNQSKGQWWDLGLDVWYQPRTLGKFLHPSNRDGKDEDTQWFAGWWFQIFVYFHPYLGKWSNFNILQMGWFNHQLVFYALTTPEMEDFFWIQEILIPFWFGRKGEFFPQKLQKGRGNSVQWWCFFQVCWRCGSTSDVELVVEFSVGGNREIWRASFRAALVWSDCKFWIFLKPL